MHCAHDVIKVKVYYKLPMFSEVYDCIVEFQYTFTKFEKKLIVEQWQMDVHFVHDHSCSTFVKFCLFGAFTIITVILQVTVYFKGHVSHFLDATVLCFYCLFFLWERFQIIRPACLEMQ